MKKILLYCSIATSMLVGGAVNAADALDFVTQNNPEKLLNCNTNYDACCVTTSVTCKSGSTCTSKRGYWSSANCLETNGKYLRCDAGGTGCTSWRRAPAQEDQMGSDKREPMTDLPEPYLGYRNSALQSPSGGRVRSCLAKLDVCMGNGHSDTDSYGGSVSSCQSQCPETGYDNIACTQSVCNSRCTGAFGGGSDSCS
jgi:hypothetical protein